MNKMNCIYFFDVTKDYFSALVKLNKNINLNVVVSVWFANLIGRVL